MADRRDWLTDCLLRGLKDLAFPPPPLCPFCGRPFMPTRGILFCRQCLGRLPFVLPPACQVCGKPLRLAGARENRCLDCARYGHFFGMARAVGLYEGLLREGIHQFKYQGRRGLGEAFASLMFSRLNVEPRMRRPDLLVPVPISPAKLARRGFNQAALLAQGIGRRLGRPVAVDGLRRDRDTLAQNQLGVGQRRRNIAGVFAVTAPAVVAGRSVLLIDDIYTTGVTADECARTLLRAGAREVNVLTLAVGVLDRHWLEAELPTV
ncbi:MAG: ComF family protein [Syntrophothermus sp.]